MSMQILNLFSVHLALFTDKQKSCQLLKKHLKKPESPYGNTKKICENILEDKTKIETQFSTVILRYFNPIGAHHSSLIGEDPRNIPQNLVPIITEFAIGKSEKLTVYGDDYPTKDGTCIRDYIHIMDLADAHISALEYLFSNNTNNCYDVFNVGTGRAKQSKKLLTPSIKFLVKKFNTILVLEEKVM